MEFCPDCGAMLLPKEGKLQCSCGYVKDLSDNNAYEVSKKVEAEETVKMIKLLINYYKPVVLMKHLLVFLHVPNVSIHGEHTTEVFL